MSVFIHLWTVTMLMNALQTHVMLVLEPVLPHTTVSRDDYNACTDDTCDEEQDCEYTYISSQC